MAKKIAIVLGSLFALFLILAITIPLMVDVDHYRPQITEAANQKINGKLELGKLKLSLWGQIRIEVAGLAVKDSKGQSLISVEDAYFHLPFLPLLTGSPVLTLKMQKPAILVVKDLAGKINLLTLMKSEPTASSGVTATPPTTATSGSAPTKTAAAGSPPPATTGAAPTTSAPAAAAPTVEMQLPGIATRARLGVEILDANLVYKDEKTTLSSQIQNFNFVLKDLSLSRPTSIEIWADLDTRMGKTMTVKGPFKAVGRSEVTMEGSHLGKLAMHLTAEADKMDILLPGLFHKSSGMAANAEVAITGTSHDLKIDKLDLNFFNVKLESSGTVTQYDSGNGRIQYTMHSNAVDLKPWNELVPMLKEYELGGTLTLGANAEGPQDKLDYSASLAVKALTMKAGNLKAQPTFDADVLVKTDQVDHFNLTMKAPANDLKIAGKLVSFTHPRLDATVTSSGMNLDQLINFPPPGAKKTAAIEPARSSPVSLAVNEAFAADEPAAVKPADFDAMLEPMRENPILASMTGVIGINLASIQAYGVKMSPITARLTLRELTAALESFSMGVFGGTIKANMSMALKPKTPTYQFTAEVSQLDLQQAVTSQFELFKNTLLGKANFKMDGHGTSFNPDAAKKNLVAKGSLRVNEATFATIDIGKMANEGINSSIGKIADKIPALKGKNLSSLNVDKASKYEYISSSFTIADGKFSAPDFVTKTYPNQGIDIKGRTVVGLIDYALDTHWEVIDTNNITKGKDLSVNIAGSDVPHILAEGNGPVRFPVSAGCNAMKPCFNYGEAPQFLASIAMKNVEQAATGRVKDEAKKRAGDALKNAAPAPVKNILNGLFH